MTRQLQYPVQAFIDPETLDGPLRDELQWFQPLSEPTLPLDRSPELLVGGTGRLSDISIVHAKYGHRAIVRPNQ